MKFFNVVCALGAIQKACAFSFPEAVKDTLESQLNVTAQLFQLVFPDFDISGKLPVLKDTFSEVVEIVTSRGGSKFDIAEAIEKFNRTSTDWLTGLPTDDEGAAQLRSNMAETASIWGEVREDFESSSPLRKVVRKYIAHQSQKVDELAVDSESYGDDLVALTKHVGKSLKSYRVTKRAFRLRKRSENTGDVESELAVETMDAADDLKYLTENIFAIITGLAFVLVCWSLTFHICVAVLGTLVTIEVIIWILVLVKYLNER
ncbi:uncharacterized protein KNAG_0M01180 [Huiozyma naganishii CBS 8797]|uniref:Uncharacterized protein n=1 Tax=Huiozyma naganishii (strain ATCC MYA-139 / BCRC 22969 / CBS 8797 / KCTC 17520 / NBRC 10181 / NCYC 3082 / Yp74L-3) TaxID=1071383 RepID=J7SBE0_HUIN7|nr:hypothetical protein KNAG_0M01180 [Kazachstania naganishii CBS 8797]CCK72971.1 hypothetical protein KNAG_0M01180 [Kazachstania naganishii CBS 8797]